MALFWGLEEWVGVEKPYESDRSFRMNIPVKAERPMRKKSIVASKEFIKESLRNKSGKW